MTILSDGRIVVWAVFDNDGYECSDFVGVFETEEEANKVAARITELYQDYYRQELYRGLKWKGDIEVKSVFLGQYELPPNCQYILDRMEVK